MAHDVSRTTGAPRTPAGSAGVLGKFGSFWMPKSPQEIIQRTGPEHSPRSGEANARAEGKAGAHGRTNAKASFRDLIHQKQGSRAEQSQKSSSKPVANTKTKTASNKGFRSQISHPATRIAPRLPVANSPVSSSKPMAPERVVAEKPSAPSNSRRELQDTLKSAKEQKDRDMHHEQKHDEQGKRDHGAENAKYGRASQIKGELPETNNKRMNAVSRDSEMNSPLSGNDGESRSSQSVASPRELSTGSRGAAFLSSDEKSQRDARRTLTLVRRHIGSFMDGEARVARIAIDLPSGGRLGIKMRFVGDQLEVIFATENPTLRAALLEDWRRLARDMGQDGARLLPPAFAKENYQGMVRSEWSEAA